MPNKQDPFDLLDDPEILAEPVAPEAAIEFWKQRAKLTWDETKGLADGAKARAFYVTGLYQQDLVNLVSDALQKALEDGETLEDFKKRIAEAISKQGWKDYRVETIFRTNMQSAYAAGRYRKMQAVKKMRPYWQYLAIMDKRTRPSHAILHGKVYPADHEFWQTNYPPNGFRCRCGVATLSERQVKAQNLTVETKMPEASVWTDPKTGMEYFVNFPGADKGFRNNPFEDWAKNEPTSDISSRKLPEGWDYAKLRGSQGEGEKVAALPAVLSNALSGVNPDYAKGDGYHNNCSWCAPIYTARRRGYEVSAKPNNNPSGNGTSKRDKMNGSEVFKGARLNGRYSFPFEKITRKKLLRALNLLPNGAIAAIFWAAPGKKSGHVIVWEKFDGKGYFMDPQSGRHGPAVLGQASQDEGYFWYRMDNLEFDENFEWDEILNGKIK